MRYRKIDVRIWGDKKFCSLSRPQPCAQMLFIYLLTSPSTTSLPGLYRLGLAALAEELGWTIEDLKLMFASLFKLDMVLADFEAKVIFIPNCIKYNPPASPNVIKSWKVLIDEIPECKLKQRALKSMKDFLKGMSKAYQEAFADVTGKSLNMSLPNQEQEQDQDQKQDQSILFSISGNDGNVSNEGGSNITISQMCPHQKIISIYHEILPMCPKVRGWNQTRSRYLRQRWNENKKHQTLEFWTNFFEYVRKSEFLCGLSQCGEGKRPFIADLEWLIKSGNFVKVIEGKYHSDGV